MPDIAFPTLQGIIAEVDTLEPNTLSYEEKVKLLSRLDGRIYEKYMKGRSGAPEHWEPYTPDTSGDTLLLVRHPWDGIYSYWLRAQIALHNGENDRYSDYGALAEQAEEDFAAGYAASHPRTGGNRFRF